MSEMSFLTYEKNKYNAKASIGMFKGLCNFIRENGGLDRMQPITQDLYHTMQIRLLRNHNINAYYSDKPDLSTEPKNNEIKK